MTIAVTLPIRIRVDPRTAADPAAVVNAFSAGFGRALETSFQSVIRPRRARPSSASEPSFTWSGEALPSVALGTRRSLESAIAHAILARVAAWNDGTVLPPPVAIEAPEAPIALVREAPIAAVREVPAVAEQPPETRTGASWMQWLALADAWDALFATEGEARAGGDAFDTQAHAFVDRLETALNFVPDVRRITETGLARNTGVEVPALDLMRAQLDRGFILAFAEALQHRDFVDFTVDRAIVPLIAIAYRYLIGDDLFPIPEKAQSLLAVMRRAFPPTRLDQILGVPIAISYDRIVASRLPIADFHDALIAGGLDQPAAAAFTASFVHALLEALVDEYRKAMDAVVDRVAAIQRTFVLNAGASPLAGVEVRRLTAEFAELVASIAGRTPLAAVESGREAAIVRKRLEKALLFVVSATPQWRADFRASPAGGFYLVLAPPPLDATDAQYYGSENGLSQLRDLVRSFAAICRQWRDQGARGLIWQTGVEWLDELLTGVVAELQGDDSLLFAELRDDG